MRILMVSDVYFPRVSGVSTSIQTFRADLMAMGHRVALVAPCHPGAAGLDDGEAVIRVHSRAVPLLLGRGGWGAALQMLGTGGIGLALYKALKNRLLRERPHIGLAGIPCAMAPLDRYSFPSGYTLHAVSFTVLAIHHVPALAPLLVPFAALVALSRVVLGLHYPSDVLAGGTLGAGLALASLRLLR